MSIKVQVIFYSMYGHVHRMAEAIVEGAKQVRAQRSRSTRSPNLFPMTF
jgi:NAD(P)H dehydrogenase (quinone)